MTGNVVRGTVFRLLHFYARKVRHFVSKRHTARFRVSRDATGDY